MRVLDNLRWKAKQVLAGESRYYGDGGTIHHTGHLNVETDRNGSVVAVWFRCQPLSFMQTRVGSDRAQEMREMYERNTYGITGVEVTDR